MRKITAIKIIAILMSFWALADNPYGYYQLLRWVITGVAGYSAYLAYEQSSDEGNNPDKNTWFWIWLAIAILFNPIFPFYLDRETWSVLNVITAVIIFINVYEESIRKITKFIEEFRITLITTFVIIFLLTSILWVHHLNQQQKKFKEGDKRFEELDLNLDLDFSSLPPPPTLPH